MKKATKKTATKAPATKPVRIKFKTPTVAINCSCGCGKPVAGRSLWLAGHDAKGKSMLLNGKISPEMLDRKHQIKFMNDPKFRKLADAAVVTK